ncbi:hypothetical protein [Novilysobacter spongiicola]|uniref:Uncharacterized protein n=1 Tax=Lysobacter spongiicola DSM 21749 TaxID=1122188 RepID=A0A1T4MYD5_9GAMM|nr:hypothetical protein [Lysobacter spongiicola]SJZ71854.1 hypothetical protein SAMN02745674_00643 [Lysobacter spongiicola DSM 21749]
MQVFANAAAPPRPVNIDQLILIIQHEFPRAGIRITGRARTIRRQAELMAQRIRANRLEFLRTYRPTQHIREMDAWYLQNRTATELQTVDAFEFLIQQARQRGALVFPTICPIPHGTSAGRSAAGNSWMRSRHA